MHLVHLTASTLFGGPERQMLGLAEALPAECRTSFVSFREGGRSADFLGQVRERGFAATELAHDTPHFLAAIRDLTDYLRSGAADCLICHGYKANLLGRVAARRVGIPAVAVSRGWTGENAKVRFYEYLDRLHLRFMDHVVAVSDGQATRVRRWGVPEKRLTVIRNAARLGAFAVPNPTYREQLRNFFPDGEKITHIVLAAGRLSPEKGFAVLTEAAAKILALFPTAGFVLFGEGAERGGIEQQIRRLGLDRRFLLPGFTTELDCYLPWADLFVIPSYTEGLPNVALEAGASGVPVVATAVGGNPEVVADGKTGFLVSPGEPGELASRMLTLLRDDAARRQMGAAAIRRMRQGFTFESQAVAYLRLLEALRPRLAPAAV